MKKLLLNSLFFILTLTLISCSNIKENSITKINNQNTEVIKGNSVLSKSSDTVSSKKGSDYKKMEIKHISPNQTKIDSINFEKAL